MVIFVLSLLICVYIPWYASAYYVRQMSDDCAWYVAIGEASSTFNNDAKLAISVIYAVLIIYIAFICYYVRAIWYPQLHRRFVLPIFMFQNKKMRLIGDGLSYICMFTMPICIPILIYVTYNTRLTSVDFYAHYNDVDSFFVYATPLLLFMGAFLFFIFYIVSFLRWVYRYIRKKH